jgi:hypothetical protein
VHLLQFAYVRVARAGSARTYTAYPLAARPLGFRPAFQGWGSVSKADVEYHDVTTIEVIEGERTNVYGKASFVGGD